MKVQKGSMKKSSIIDNIEFNVLALPAIIFFFIFAYLPMFGIIIAFKEYRYDLGILGSNWVGLSNFTFFFTSQDALRVTRNTVGYGMLFIILNLVTSVSLALLLYEVKNKSALKYFQTTMILPNYLSWVVVGYISYIFLNPVIGVINQFLAGLSIDKVQWYAEPKHWPFILSFVNIWKNVGMGSVIYFAALINLDTQLFEAAQIDGASKLQQTWYISIPALIPIMTMLSILSVGNIMRGDFGLFFQIPRDVGSLYPATDIIDTYIYRGLRKGTMGQTAAIGLFQSVVGFILVILTNFIVKKIDPENAMF